MLGINKERERSNSYETETSKQQQRQRQQQQQRQLNVSFARSSLAAGLCAADDVPPSSLRALAALEERQGGSAKEAVGRLGGVEKNVVPQLLIAWANRLPSLRRKRGPQGLCRSGCFLLCHAVCIIQRRRTMSNNTRRNRQGKPGIWQNALHRHLMAWADRLSVAGGPHAGNPPCIGTCFGL